MTPDPLGGDVSNPQSLNRYAYVLNNPTSMVDPLGLCSDYYCPPPGCTDSLSCANLFDGLGEMLGWSDLSFMDGVWQNAWKVNFLSQCAQGGNCSSGSSYTIGGTTYSWVTSYTMTALPPGSQAQFSMVDTSHWQPTNDPELEMDIWHSSAQCPNCAQLWTNDETFGKALTVATGAAVVVPPAIAYAPETYADAQEWVSANPDAVVSAGEFMKGFFTDEPLESVPAQYGRVMRIVYELMIH